MTTELEKLETMRDVLSITSIVLMVVAFIMIISLIFIRVKINDIYDKEMIENITKKQN